MKLTDLARHEGHLLVESVGQTLVVTLNRPTVANALDQALMDDLADLWRNAADADDLRCVVITGSGRAFCAGADASMLASARPKVGDTAAAELAFVPGEHLEVPIVTLVNGACAGGGLHFVADADICIASADAKFVDPHVSVGQVTALEPLLLRFRMRSDVLSRMVLLGRSEMLSAEDARTAGLISEVVAAGGLMERGLELAGAIAANSPEAIRLSRKILRTFERRLIETDLDLGWELLRRHRAHPDASEGPKAFLEKRDAVWTVE